MDKKGYLWFRLSKSCCGVVVIAQWLLPSLVLHLQNILLRIRGKRVTLDNVSHFIFLCAVENYFSFLFIAVISPILALSHADAIQQPSCFQSSGFFFVYPLSKWDGNSVKMAKNIFLYYLFELSCCFCPYMDWKKKIS